MCQYSEPDMGDDTSALARAMALKAKHLSKRRAISSSSTALDHKAFPRSSPSDISTAHGHCVCGWWRDALCNTSQEFNAHRLAFSLHIDSLQTTQRRMHRLARKCAQVRLYPNPASTSKSVLRTQLNNLVANMDFATRIHGTYSVALDMYSFPVRAIIDCLDISGKECHCSNCALGNEPWATDTITEISLEARSLLDEIKNMVGCFKSAEKDLLKKWEKDGRDALRRMIDALPEQEDLMNMNVVKKYFPRQVREIEEAEDRTVRKATVIRGVGNKEVARHKEEKCDSGCETSP